MTDRNEKNGFATRAIHAGENPDASAVPIYQAATVEGSYSRDGHNPTVEAFEAKVCELEGGNRSLAMASGMAAITQVLMSLLETGDRLVTHKTMYSGVQHLLKDLLPKYGFEIAQIDMTDPEQLVDAVKTPTSVVYFEPIANPYIDVIDAPAAIEIAHNAGALTVVDNTFLTPYLYRPIENGADVVIHSATKYLCGHGDTIAGVATVGNADVGQRILKTRHYFGGILAPANAFLLSRGMKTLPFRMDRHCESAKTIAMFLDQHSRIRTVYYPGLASSPGYDVASAYLTAHGGMIGFETTSDLDWETIGNALSLIKPWVSLGDATTLMTKRGDRRVRLSVGLEDADDIISDLDRALLAGVTG